MRSALVPFFLLVVVAGCGAGKSQASGASVCCSAVDGTGASSCTCQPVGTVSQSGLTSTLTVSGGSCNTATTFLGSTTMSSGTVVDSCDDAGAPAPQPDGGTDAAQGDASSPGAGFTPAAIRSKLAFWFDPTSLVVSGGIVVKWTDLSGKGNDAVQSTTTYAPTYTSAAINGLPSATFSGPATFLVIADAASMRWATDDVLVLAVERGEPQTAADGMLYQKTAPPPYDGVNLYLNADKPVATTRVGAQVSGQVYVVSAPPPATFVDGSVHLVGIRRTGTTLEARIDGVVSNSIVNASVAVDVSAPGHDAVIGQNGSPAQNEFQQFHGDIAEMIAVDGSLAQSELDALEQYLKARYAIP
ncbi:MAG TPA: hypothetical protein VE987_03060 [Polyangiaceae bacterium]|nr:hypothetical protein [Polyangiaceae bacterium]